MFAPSTRSTETRSPTSSGSSPSAGKAVHVEPKTLTAPSQSAPLLASLTGKGRDAGLQLRPAVTKQRVLEDRPRRDRKRDRDGEEHDDLQRDTEARQRHEARGDRAHAEPEQHEAEREDFGNRERHAGHD